jgi:tetratricopeptide (TPR) repeat protein
MRDLLSIEKNSENLKRLREIKKHLVPFIGTGFSVPFRPGWEQFLEDYFHNLESNELLLPGEIEDFKRLKIADRPNRLERMADFLLEKAGKGAFKKEMLRKMKVIAPLDKAKKFHLLHHAFPFLKITSNYDTLIETTVPHGIYVKVAYGCDAGELNRLFTRRYEQNCLLKIHGGIEDMDSIVVSSSRYQVLYGHAEGYDVEAMLPSFLKRIFIDTSVLFIGCSFEKDRIAMIIEDLTDMRPHFAAMKLPKTGREKILLKRWLNNLGITVIWLEDDSQVEEILAYLVDKSQAGSVPPAQEELFVGREKELETIEPNLEKGSAPTKTGRLYSIVGIGGVGKTSLAIEAARRFKDKFIDGVPPIFRVDEHTPVSFAMALAANLNVKLGEPPDVGAALQAVTAMLKDRRCLIILDNAVEWTKLRYMIPLETPATILLTTRNREIYDRLRLEFPGLQVHEIALEKFTHRETLELFHRMLGGDYREGDEPVYLEIASHLGFLPIALRQAISLMLYGPHYPAAKLRDKLSHEDRLALLRQGQAVEESNSRTIEAAFDLSAGILTKELIQTLEYLAICSPGPVPSMFLRRLSNEKHIEDRLEELYTYSWCERREIDGERLYELHRLVREMVRGQLGKRFLEDFLRLVHDIFTDGAVHFSIKELYFPQLEEAFAAAVQNKDPRLKDWLYSLYYFCTYRGYVNFYLRLTEAIEKLFPDDRWTLRTVWGHRALIFQDWGKLEEAMALHKKEEQLAEELDDRAGLARSYGNQALILKAWGKLEEAMTLHKKAEKIKEELGDRAGLAACFGNQALILYDVGKLDEAMTLHKKQQVLCEKLGDRAGLARSYGNQALILKELGHLDKAMGLLEKQETLVEELGDRAELARSYGNQALILKEQGHLDKAMGLLEKQETLVEALGDRAGLAICWWNQGNIWGKRGDFHTQARLWRQAIAVNKNIGIPTDKDEQALENLLEKIS